MARESGSILGGGEISYLHHRFQIRTGGHSFSCPVDSSCVPWGDAGRSLQLDTSFL